MKIDFIIYILVLNFLLFYNYKYLSNKINIYDYPDKIRKFHKKKTPLIGGVFLIFIVSLLFLISLINYDINFFFNLQFANLGNLLIFLLFTLFFFILGVIDDKFNLAASQKIIYLMILSYLILLSNDNFLIKSLRFESFEKEIDLFQYSYFFSIFAIVIFVNAMNMYDGINLQSSSYFLILYIYFLFINFSMLNVSIVLFLLLHIIFKEYGYHLDMSLNF